MTEQEEDVAVKVEELTLAQITVSYWKDRVATSERLARTDATSIDQLLADVLEQNKAESARRVAEIRLRAAKSRLPRSEK